MRQDVENYVRECDECHRRKQGREYRHPLEKFDSLPTLLSLFPWIFVDHIRSPQERISIFWLLLTILLSTQRQTHTGYDCRTCAWAYASHVITRHGTGSVLWLIRDGHSPQCFFKENCKILGIKKMNTSENHPQANGTIERYHKTNESRVEIQFECIWHELG